MYWPEQCPDPLPSIRAAHFSYSINSLVHSTVRAHFWSTVSFGSTVSPSSSSPITVSARPRGCVHAHFGDFASLGGRRAGATKRSLGRGRVNGPRWAEISTHRILSVGFGLQTAICISDGILHISTRHVRVSTVKIAGPVHLCIINASLGRGLTAD